VGQFDSCFRGAFSPNDWQAIVEPMKKPRVVIKTVSSHQIYVEHNGERTLYAVTDKLEKAKGLVRKAKRELGIARGSISKKSGLSQAEPDR
jgi:hypothetical protein